MKKVFTTAIIVQPPKELSGPIQAIRQKHDKAYDRWMPHVNLVFPFMEFDQLAEGAAKLSNALSTFKPFHVTLATFNHFEHSGNCVMWLQPDTDRKDALKDLEAEIVKTFPEFDEQTKKSEHGFSPHITCGQFNKKGIEETKAKFQSDWKPIEFDVDRVYIIKRGADTPFEIAHEVKFGEPVTATTTTTTSTTAKEETSAPTVEAITVPSSVQNINEPVNVQYIPLGDSVMALSVSILDKHIRGEKRQKNVYIALDKSGSMASSFKDAKAAVQSLIVNLRNRGATNIDVVFYSSSSSTLSTAKMTEEQLTQSFNKVFASGGTNFTDAFGFISSLAENTTNDVAVVFFSDGQDTSDTTDDQRHVKSALKLLKNSLAKEGGATEVHALGFTEEHDAVLLGSIANLGSTQGSFQYIKQATGIAAAVEDITGLIAGQKIASLFESASGAMKLMLDDNKKGNVFISKQDFEAGNLSVIVGNYRYPLVLEAAPASQATLMTIKFIESEIRQLTSVAVSGAKREVLEGIRKKIDHYDDLVNDAIKSCFKLGSIDRKQAIQDCLEIKSMIGGFHQLLAEAMANTLTNDKIATFTSLTYKNVTKKGLQKRLDKLAEKNVDLYEKLEQNILKAIEAINFKEVREKATKEKREQLTCALSMKDYIDAMEDQDCMCITLSVGRSQAAIADPSQLSVRAVNQTLMTADTFMESVKYAVENAEDPTTSHGGFTRSFVASVVKGLAREDITGCMPLYISPEHWSIAKEKMKPLMGWVTTLDVMGYAYSQVKIVPFLVLACALQGAGSGSAFQKQQFDLVLETCRQIYLESANLREELKESFEKYLKDPAARTVDVISNNFVFLGHILCALQNNDIKFESDKQRDEFFLRMTEEQIRRRMGYKCNPPNAEDLFVVFNIDKHEFVDRPVLVFDDEYTDFVNGSKEKKGASPWSIAMQALTASAETPVSKGQEETKGEEEKKPVGAVPTLRGPTFDGHVKFSDATREYINHITEAVSEDVRRISHFREYFINNNVKYDYTQPILPGISDATKLALYTQNYLQQKNADRRYAIETGNYIDPFESGNEIKIVKKQLDERITAGRTSGSQAVINREAAKQSSSVGNVFAWTTDPYEAAGLLMMEVKSHGRQPFHYILQALHNKNIPLAKEKIEMVATGKFKGVPVLKNKTTPLGESAQFPPASSIIPRFCHNIFQAWLNNNSTISRAEWEAMFPHVSASYLDKIYRIFAK